MTPPASPPGPARPPALPEHDRVFPALPPHRGKVERITDHLAGISESARELVELRIDLARREIMEFVEGKLSTFKGGAIVGALFALAGLFFCVALALGFAGVLIAVGLSWPLSYFLGFLLITMIFAGTGAYAKAKLAPGAVRVEVDNESGKVRIAIDETPAEYERRKAAEEGRPVDPAKTGSVAAETERT